MRRRQWIFALAVLLATLPAGACRDKDAKPAANGLAAFDSCRSLLTDVRAAALKSVGPWGLPGGQIVAVSDSRSARIAGPAAVEKADAAPAGGFSTTNAHELDADEPDLVKSDGRRIVTVSGGGVLRVIDAATRRQTGRLSLGVPAGEASLLLAGDRALVLARPGGGVVIDRKMPGATDVGRVEIMLVDLAGAPRLLGRYRGGSALVDARQTGSVARVVLSSAPRIVFPRPAAGSDSTRLRQNQQAIRNATVDAWLPTWEITAGGRKTTGKLDCSAVRRPASFSGANLLTVLSFDLTAPTLTDGMPVSVLADGDIVYGTGDSLYVANNQSWRGTSGSVDTEIFKFTLPPTGKPLYTASGTVSGSLLNQYALSEWDGYLRVATTDAAGTSSAVRVLAEQGGKLSEVGQVGGLGKGERIFSVRFIGARGYVVTFRQTDPVFSLDLSDPAHPRLTGELKISGYSAHLQPAGDGRLIGVGRDTDGLLVSYFDVSDPAAPRRLDWYVVSDTWSEAESDPHAILWWPATKLLVLPVNGTRANGAMAFRVADDGIYVAGRITDDGHGAIRRALVVGDDLWTLSDQGLMSSNLSTMAKTGWIRLS